MITEPTVDPNLVADYEALLEFVYLCPLAIAQLDARGGIEMMNSAGAQIFLPIAGGGDLDNFFDLLAPHAPQLRALADGLTAATGTICEALRVELVSTSEKVALPVVLTVTLLKSSPTRLMAVVADISKSAAQERASRAAEDRFRAILDGVRDYAIFAVDRDGRVDSWNKSAERLFGYTPAEIVGRPYRLLCPADPDPSAASAGRDPFSRAQAGGWSEEEGWWARKETTRFWGTGVLSIVEDAEGGCTGFTSIVRDLTRRKRREEALVALANTDPLTGACNRRYLAEAGTRELARFRDEGETFSVLALDADHFKAVNDTFGHPGGDLVLVELARICKDQVRDVDTVARMGGEEFCILLPATDHHGARSAAERIRIAVESWRLQRPEGMLRVTISIGVAEVEAGTADLDALLAAADGALYEAKRRGRNRTVTVTA